MSSRGKRKIIDAKEGDWVMLTGADWTDRGPFQINKIKRVSVMGEYILCKINRERSKNIQYHDDGWYALFLDCPGLSAEIVSYGNTPLWKVLSGR